MRSRISGSSPVTGWPCRSRSRWPAVVLYLGCLRAGAVFLPLNPAYTAAEVELLPARRRAARPRLRSRPVDARRTWPGRASRTSRRWAPTGRLAPRPPLARRPSGRTPSGPARPGRHPLHVGHDRAVQGGHAHPRQPARRTRRRCVGVLAVHAPTTCSCTPCPSSTPTACSWPPTWSWPSGGAMIFLPGFDAGRRARRARSGHRAHGRADLLHPPPRRSPGSTARGRCRHIRLFVSGSAPLLAETHADVRERAPATPSSSATA